nr:reverse transcriptase domain-containing protein [Tanacetum cinerariifolium]
MEKFFGHLLKSVDRIPWQMIKPSGGMMCQGVRKEIQTKGVIEIGAIGPPRPFKDGWHNSSIVRRWNLHERRPEECYDLIKNMTAHHNDWDTSAKRSESSSSITSSFDPEIVALKAEMAEINKNLMRVLQPSLATLRMYMLQEPIKMNIASSSGSGTLPGNTITNPKEDLKGNRSFMSTTFSTLLVITPNTLGVSYAVELADGKIFETNTVLRGCTLGLLGHQFNIDLMPVELGSFDVIIGMDWLANHHAVIICDEKIMRIPYGDEVLIVQGDRSDKGNKSKLSII